MRAGAKEVRVASPLRALLKEALSNQQDECIQWPFAKLRGYGVMRFAGRQRAVSHIILRASGRRRPSQSHVAAHAPIICHDPSCINPQHLRWATRAENMADRALDGTNTGSCSGPKGLRRADYARYTHLSKRGAADALGVSPASIRRAAKKYGLVYSASVSAWDAEVAA